MAQKHMLRAEVYALRRRWVRSSMASATPETASAKPRKTAMESLLLNI
jgi:hypothetical protein